MIGETTLSERIVERLKRMDAVHKHYSGRFSNLSIEDLVTELISDAAWLALYHGMDFETLVASVTEDVRRKYPDTI